MSSGAPMMPPPDAGERAQALDARRSVLVQAPAGSGKTDLLTRRFLRLLAEVEEPGQIVAITFTKAAAAEMRHRILSELEKAAHGPQPAADADPLSMQVLAARALSRSTERDWNLIELPSQLRITTIDAFCRELAVQQPLLSGLGGGLEIFDDPKELYRRAARRTLEQIDDAEPVLREALERMLLWRDNGWQEMENLLVEMLAKRDRWMHEFVLQSEKDWDALRTWLEMPFRNAVRGKLEELSALLDLVPHARQEVLALARFACHSPGERSPLELAEHALIPEAPFSDGIDGALEIYQLVARFLQTQKGAWCSEKGLNALSGFPATDAGRAAKKRFGALIAQLREVAGLERMLAEVCTLPPVRYAEEDWQIVRACFVLLKEAAVQLKVVFAEAGAVDYTEIAQIALQVLKEEVPEEGALAFADEIRHLLVDEFQDTSRRQHQLIGRLIAAWPEREGRTCFLVGDPMQSIYFFRDADAELFPQVRDSGLKIPNDQPLMLDATPLRANFRTERSLLERMNEFFAAVFAENDGSGVRFTPAESPHAREAAAAVLEWPRLHSHFTFMPCSNRGRGNAAADSEAVRAERTAVHESQIAETVELIRAHLARIPAAREEGKKYRIAVLGRAHTALAPIAEALRKAEIPFRAIELESLSKRPEVMDALSLTRALLNPYDRLAWLGILRAPWCGLDLADLHKLVSADDAAVLARPVRELIVERQALLTEQSGSAVARVLNAVQSAEQWRANRPGTTLGSWIEHAWLQLGGAACVDAAARANVDLLWQCLDGLPEGDADVTGSALDAALEGLKALPDARADGDYGVQMMTIHKSKGLEFEVVIVPELQAKGGRTKFGLLSWLERGLSAPDENGEITEFLVAPIQSKGGDSGKTRDWVNKQYKERERQEARRILYVAGTRARSELHLFARPEFSIAATGTPELVQPKGSLLETAWPAVKDEVARQFAEWVAQWHAQAGEVESIAAVAADLFAAIPTKRSMLQRLPADFQPPVLNGAARREDDIAEASAEPLYRRHEGGLLSRALGTAVHFALEEAARLRASAEWDSVAACLAALQPKLAAQVRAVGVDPAQAKRVAAQALEITKAALGDPEAQWVLSPHADAVSEANWIGLSDRAIHSVRVDRVFRAGMAPGTAGSNAWWIVDFKTAHAGGLEPDAALSELRKMFAPQLEAYARVLRGLRGEDAVVRAGLYYPRMRKFDWWAI